MSGTVVIDTLAKFDDLLEALRHAPREIGFDTETTGLDFFGLSDRNEADLATGWTQPARLCGLSLALTGEETVYLPFRHETDEPQLPLGCLGALVAVLEAEGKALVMHNAKFDLKALAVDGYLPDRTQVTIHDTIVLAHVLKEDRESFTLEKLTESELGIVSPRKRAQWTEFKARKYRRFSQFSVKETEEYAGDDAANPLLLWHHLYPNLTVPMEPWWGDESQRALYHTEMDLTWLLLDLELRGIRIDVERTTQLRDGLTTKLLALQETVNAFVGPTARPVEKRKASEHDEGCPAPLRGEAKGDCVCPPIYKPFLVSSHPQLVKLFTERSWPLPADPENPLRKSFTDDLLVKLEVPDPTFNEFRTLIGAFRTTAKQRSYYESYLELKDERGFLHPSFKQHGTVTGRMSCEKPNMQQIPKDRASTLVAALGVEAQAPEGVRTVFFPRTPDHCFVTFDYSQQEVRMLAHYAKDQKLIDFLMDPKGDIHALIAELLFGKAAMGPRKSERWDTLRFYAKSVVFGIMYGMGKAKLARTMSLDQPLANKYWDDFMQMFQGVPEFMELVRRVAKTRKYVRNPFGRRRRMHQYTAEELAAGYAKRRDGFVKIREGELVETHRALNSLIQGGCADLTKRAMLRCVASLEGTRSLLVNQVHDDLLFEVHKDERSLVIPRLRDALERWELPNGSPMFRVPFYTDLKVGEPGAAWSTVSDAGGQWSRETGVNVLKEAVNG